MTIKKAFSFSYVPVVYTCIFVYVDFFVLLSSDRWVHGVLSSPTGMHGLALDVLLDA